VFLRAMGGYAGGNTRARVLTIVRNTAWLARNRKCRHMSCRDGGQRGRHRLAKLDASVTKSKKYNMLKGSNSIPK